MLLATLLVRSQFIPSSIFTYSSHTAPPRRQTGKLLVAVSIGASMLAFITVIWELLG